MSPWPFVLKCHISLAVLSMEMTCVTLISVSLCRAGCNCCAFCGGPALLPVTPTDASQRGRCKPEAQLQKQHLQTSEVKPHTHTCWHTLSTHTHMQGHLKDQYHRTPLKTILLLHYSVCLTRCVLDSTCAWMCEASDTFSTAYEFSLSCCCVLQHQTQREQSRVYFCSTSNAL